MKKLLVVMMATIAFLCLTFAACGGKEEAPTTYTVTIAVDNATYGTVSKANIENVAKDTAISVNGNVLTVGEETVTATATANNAQYTYAFTGFTGTAATVTGDIEITANFSRTVNKYTVTFEMGDGEAIDSIEVEYGTSVSALSGMEVTAPAHYHLAKWQYFDGNGYVDFAGTETIEGDITVQAVYEIDTFTVTFGVNNEEYGSVIEGKYEVVAAQTMNDLIKAYREDSYLNIENYVVPYSAGMRDYTKPYPVKFDWTDAVNGENHAEYTLHLSESETFANEKTYSTENTCLDVYNLFVNTRYFWKVTADGFESAVNVVETDEFAPRFIAVDGVTNFRDLGGYIVSGDKTIKQGLIYRSSRLDDISESGKRTAKEVLGIKTEIDLRRAQDGATRSEGPGRGYLGAGVYYYKCEMDYSLLSDTNIASVKKFFEILSDENNYPVVFHCSAGADRTGFLAYLINAVLGADKEDLYDDYQATNFAKQQERGRYYSAIQNYVDAIDSKSGGTLSEKAVNFLLENKEVSSDHLIALKEIMFGQKATTGVVEVTETIKEYGTLISTNGNVIKIGDAFYAANPATKTNLYTYSFIGWTGIVDAVTGNIEIVANFARDTRYYTVKFLNDDGTELQSDELEYGEMPSYSGETPEKAPTAVAVFEFDDWTPEIVAVTEDVIYTATYTATINPKTSFDFESADDMTYMSIGVNNATLERVSYSDEATAYANEEIIAPENFAFSALSGGGDYALKVTNISSGNFAVKFSFYEMLPAGSTISFKIAINVGDSDYSSSNGWIPSFYRYGYDPTFVNDWRENLTGAVYWHQDHTETGGFYWNTISYTVNEETDYLNFGLIGNNGNAHLVTLSTFIMYVDNIFVMTPHTAFDFSTEEDLKYITTKNGLGTLSIVDYATENSDGKIDEVGNITGYEPSGNILKLTETGVSDSARGWRVNFGQTLSAGTVIKFSVFIYNPNATDNMWCRIGSGSGSFAGDSYPGYYWSNHGGGYTVWRQYWAEYTLTLSNDTSEVEFWFNYGAGMYNGSVTDRNALVYYVDNIRVVAD